MPLSLIYHYDFYFLDFISCRFIFFRFSSCFSRHCFSAMLRFLFIFFDERHCPSLPIRHFHFAMLFARRFSILFIYLLSALPCRHDAAAISPPDFISPCRHFAIAAFIFLSFFDAAATPLMPFRRRRAMPRHAAMLPLLF
jgi:hypothetical protein